MSALDLMPARHRALEVAEFDSALVVFNAESNLIHLIQQVHAVVFDACDGSTPRASLVAEFFDAGIGSEHDVEELISHALRDLSRLGLLEGTTARKPPPCIGCGSETKQRPRRKLLSRK